MLRGNRVIGILRESKNKWEQRAPLAPRHVKKLVQQGIKVIVQPSTRRTFYDAEYLGAGATVQENVEAASLILGVKEVPIQDLIPERNYLFFSHVTKAQDYNMPLLDAILEKNIRLFDYEMITETGDRQSPRLVAFGRFAGIAGMIDICRGLGERLLGLGHTNPFMKIGSTYMYESLDVAEDAVSRAGQQLAHNGTPPSEGPLVFTFTGDGMVSRGAQEIFSLLPHEWVSTEDLPHLISNNGRNADLHKCYGVVANPKDYIVCRDGQSTFNKQHYYDEPHEFKSIFHKTHLPYTSVLMNCMFWTQTYPRIVTNAHLQELDLRKKLRMLALGDITCDFKGSVECLQKFSTIEDPFYMFDPQTSMVHNNLESHGFLVQAVDTLPAELPKEATNHFGDHLMPLLPNLLESDGTKSLEEQQAELNPAWFGAMITSQGKLTPSYSYIADLRNNNERIAALHTSRGHDGDENGLISKDNVERIMLRGHLFDNAIINKVLDIIEGIDHCDIEMVNWTLGTKRSETTTAVFDIIGDGPEPQVPVDTALEHIGALTDALRIISPIACRNITGLEVNYTSDSNSVSQVAPASIPVDGCVGSSILVLGSGMVVGPALDVMVDSGANVTLASNDLPAAEALVAEQTSKPNLATDQSLEVVLLDMQTGTSLLSSLIASHDVVVSLLPASMHVQVASLCLDNRTHFVSASYESPSMRELDLRAKEIGVTLLNEIGLDPGIDHMSAMQIIDEAHAKGEVIESFTSLCGGLPSPQASDNPLGYKFSWNPAGVLQASQNPAHFIFRNQEKKIPGDQLMLQCRPVQIGSSALSLEQLPNRDSLMYRELYGLPCAHTVYRGTIRYTGFAPIIHSLLRCGMFSDRVIKEVIPHTTDEKPVTWADLMDAVVKPVPNRGLQKTLQERLELDFFGDNSKQLAETSVKAFEYLGIFNSDPKVDVLDPNATIRDSICERLEERLTYANGESDMVLLYHEFDIRSADKKTVRRVTSTLHEYGEPYPKGPSAMASTVGLPVGIAALMVLNGTISRRGTVLPLTSDIYEPVLSKLADLGIKCTEREIDVLL